MKHSIHDEDPPERRRLLLFCAPGPPGSRPWPRCRSTDAPMRPAATRCTLGLAVGPAVPAEITTLADFIAWIRKHPGDANIGSPGTGTLPHLLEAMLFREEAVAWQHVAYSGGPPAVTALLGGQIAALALPEGLLRQHHASRRVRVLATSGPARSAYLPDVPSFVERGVPTSWSRSGSPFSLRVGCRRPEQRYWQPVLRANDIHAE